MIITTLEKLVDQYSINTIEVNVGEGVNPMAFEIDSPDYREQQNYLVKGEYRIRQDFATGKQILWVDRLEEEFTKPAEEEIAEDEPTAEEIAIIEEHFNTPITAIFFHRQSLQSTALDISRKEVPHYAESVVNAYAETFGETSLEEFAMVEIDWKNQAVSLVSIPQPTVEPEPDSAL